MPTFLTVREAALRYGKSPTSIRRAIYPITRDDTHPDRGEIQPSVDEALKLRVSGVSFPWQISEDLLRRVVRVDATPPRSASNTAAHGSFGHTDDIIAILRSELDIKNQQIAANIETEKSLNETIRSLTERIRETNILLGGLQQRLGLTDGRDMRSAEATESKTVTPIREQGSAPSPKPTKVSKTAATPPKAPKPKKGLFQRWFT